MKRLILATLILFSLSYTLVQGATFYLYPQYIELVEGEDVLVDLYLDTEGESINALEVEGEVGGTQATVRSIDTGSSFIEIFAERPRISDNEQFRLAGGVPSGFTGSGVVGKLLIRGEIPGATVIAVTPESSQVLRADGTADPVLIKAIGSEVRVIPRSADYVAVSSKSHPSQAQWYQAESAALHWDLKPEKAYSYLVSRDPNATPDDQPDKPEGSRPWYGDVQVDSLDEGVLYFTIKQIGSDVVSRYRLMSDVSEPVWVSVEVSPGTPETEGKPFLNVLAKDNVSGIEYYEVRVDGAEPLEIGNSYVLPGEYRTMSVRAYDFAGNYIEKNLAGTEPLIPAWAWLLLVALILARLFGILKGQKREA